MLDEDEDDAPSYIGDLGTLDRLRRAANADGVAIRTKSVTIHPDVTEFHYPGKAEMVCHKE